MIDPRSAPRFDLNCDLGEGEPAARTRALMRRITSANVACGSHVGGHAGTLASMTRAVRLAAEFGVHLGAHPGPASPVGDFGRGPVTVTPETLATQVVQQVTALATVAATAGVPLHHIKLHGAWYHASEADPHLARAYLRAVQQHFPHCAIYALSGGRVVQLARELGMTVLEEIFADRAYRADGTLVPRNEPGAVLSHIGDAVARLRHWAATGQMSCADGQWIKLRGDTVCIHGDGPHALALLRGLRGL